MSSITSIDEQEEMLCSSHNDMMDTIDLTYEEEHHEKKGIYDNEKQPYQTSSNPHQLVMNNVDDISITKNGEPSKERSFLEITKIQSIPLQSSPSVFSKSSKQTKVIQDLTIQCPLCYDWFESHLIESHAAICPAGDQPEEIPSMGVTNAPPPPPPSSMTKEYFNDFADIVISDFSDEKEEDEVIPPIVSTLSPGKHHRKSSSCSSLDDRLLTDRGNIRFQLLEPLSPIKNFVNLFDLHRQGTRTYQNGTMIFDYLGQFAVDPRRSKSKILEKQQKTTVSSQKSLGKSTKAKWFAKKRFFAKRK